jgi:hypothetical protein
LQLYLDLDDVARAGELVNMHRRRYPSDLNVAWGSAILSATLGDTAAAERDARAIMATWPRNPFPHFLVRNAALKRGDFRGARAQYARDYPELLGAGPPRIDAYNYTAAIDLVPVLRGTGESDRVRQLLDGSERVLGTQPRLGISGFGVCDVAIYALRGDKARALVALREAEQAGWRTAWRYTRDFDPNFESIRNEPEFKAVFADIERDIARQRAALAARSKDAPLDIGVTGT